MPLIPVRHRPAVFHWPEGRATARRRPRRTRRAWVVLLAGTLLVSLAQPALARSGGKDAVPAPVWTGTWGAAPTAAPAADGTTFHHQTIRQIVRISTGGSQLRLRLSNEFGDRQLELGEVRVAERDTRRGGTAIRPGSDRPVTFGGRPGITVPARAPALSDPVSLPVADGSELVISVYLPRHTPGSTLNAYAYQQNYVADGNVTRDRTVDPVATHNRWYFLTGVQVAGSDEPGHRPSAIVALGDSMTAITELGTNQRWPDLLGDRLRAAPHVRDTGVINQGINGNRLLRDPNPPQGSDAEASAALWGESGLRRFDRDVLSQPGARHVIVLLGTNDIGHPGTGRAPESERVSAEELITGQRQLIARARAAGLRIYAGTITPFRDSTQGFYTPHNEAVRQEVNAWLRATDEFDGVIDFDRAVRDPARPDRLHPAYDQGDHLHLNDRGNAAMAAAVPLHWFR